MKTLKKNWLALFFAGILALSMVGCRQVDAPEAGQTSAATETSITAQTNSTETQNTESGQTSTEAQTATGALTSTGAGETDSSEYIDEFGSYTTKEDVALYIHVYHKLPENFMTKSEARKLGWTGGSLEPYAEGMCIGGDYFGNYEEILPEGSYRECDIDTLGRSSRGAKRIIYSDEWTIYYTGDHYESFELLYEE